MKANITPDNGRDVDKVDGLRMHDELRPAGRPFNQHL
jgi:hypothetical protein